MGNSGGGTASDGSDTVGNDVDDSLVRVYNESRTHAGARFLPRGRFDLVAAHDFLGRSLRCKKNG